MKRINTIAALVSMAAVSAFALGVAEGGSGSSVEASGPIVSETRDLSRFQSIELSGSGTVRYRESDSFRVTVTARESVIGRVLTRVSGDELELRVERGFTIRGDGRIEYLVEAPALSGIAISGSGSFSAERPIVGRTFSADISGSGDIAAELEAESVDARISGSGSVDLSGAAGSLDFQSSGSGELKAERLEVRQASIVLSGSGNAAVSVDDQLRVRISGSGSVSYAGRPQVDFSSSGSGKIKSLD
jgi:hypothetical protein